MSTPTAGDWYAEDYDPTTCEVSIRARDYRFGYHPIIARTTAEYVSGKETIANARFMKAAPKMFQALLVALAALPIDGPAAEQVRQAIAATKRNEA